MIVLDNSVLFTGVPSIQGDLRLSAASMSWAQDAYTLVFGGFLLLGARTGDLLGRRRALIIGLVVFVVASLFVGLAQNGGWLISARALQGVGAALVAPSSLALITASFPPGQERARAVAWYGATAGIGGGLGLVIGGACAHLLSWRAGFFLNVPIGAAVMVLAPKVLAETQQLEGRFDLIGAMAATAGVGVGVFAVSHAVEVGWGSLQTLVCICAAVVLLIGLILHEHRVAQPIIPLRLFASRERSGAYISRFLYMGAMIGFFYFTSQYLQTALGFNPLIAGLAFLPMTAVNFVTALLVPRLSRRLGAPLLLIVGVAATLIGIFWLSRASPETPYAVAVAAPMVLIGAGQGFTFAPLTSAGISGISGSDAGAASGIVNTAHQLGQAVGLSVLVSVAATGTGHGADQAVTQTHAAFVAASILPCLCLATILVTIVPGTRETALANAETSPELHR